MFATGEDVFPFSGDVIIRYNFPVFIDNEPLFIRLKGISPFFNQACCLLFFCAGSTISGTIGILPIDVVACPTSIIIDAFHPCACGFIFADYRVAKGVLDLYGNTAVIIYRHGFPSIRRLVFLIFGFILRPHGIDRFCFLPGFRVIRSFCYQTVFIGVTQLIAEGIIGHFFLGVSTVICRTFCGSDSYTFLGLLSESVVGVIILDHFFFPIRAVGRVDFPLGFISMPVIPEIRFGNGLVCPAVYAFLLGNAGIVNAIRCHRAYHLMSSGC